MTHGGTNSLSERKVTVRLDTTSANALGDRRSVWRREQCVASSWHWMEENATYQRELRATIPRGGRRALYLDHLHALAEDTGALLTLYHPKGFVAQWRGETKEIPGGPPEITTSLPLTREHYLTGLHEFGHVYQSELGGSGEIG